MKIETSINMPDKIFRGNSIDIEGYVNIESLDECVIKAEIFDAFYSSIKLSSEVEGEISISEEDDGSFIIHIAKDTTNLFHLISYIELTLIDADEKEITIYYAPIKFVDNQFMRI